MSVHPLHHPDRTPTERLVTALTDAAEAMVEMVADRVGVPAYSPPPLGENWLRGAKNIAAAMGCPRSRVYELAERTDGDCPIRRDGRTLIAERSELDHWLRERT